MLYPRAARTSRPWSAAPATEVSIPKGNNRALGRRYYDINGIWDLNPHYLGPWTLRGCFRGITFWS